MKPVSGYTAPAEHAAQISYPKRLPAKIENSASEILGESYRDRVLEIQIQADKDHGIFVSLDESEENFRKAREEFGLARNSGLQILDYYLQDGNEDEYKEAIEWSTALAKYRFAENDHEKLELIKDLIDSAIAKGDFERSDKIIDCETKQIEFDNLAENERVMISFHASVRSDIDLWGNASTTQEGRVRVNSIFSGLEKMGQKHKKEVLGVLYAWSLDDHQLESCDFSIPYQQ